MQNKFDVVIPCHPKDFNTLNLVIEGVKKNLNYNQIYVVTPALVGGYDKPDVKFVLDDVYYEHSDIKKIQDKFKNSSRKKTIGWLFQQTIKLFSHRVLEDLTESYLCLDADTIFTRPVQFDTDKFQYLKVEEYHRPYVETYNKLYDSRSCGFSMISHHMMFNKTYMEELISSIESKHGSTFLDALLNSININQKSPFSEWDLYGNFMLLHHSDVCQLRELKWYNNVSNIPSQWELEHYPMYYDFISTHAYRRGR